jgi:hypothetical protein
MKTPAVVADGRNVLSKEDYKLPDFVYRGVGKG